MRSDDHLNATEKAMICHTEDDVCIVQRCLLELELITTEGTESTGARRSIVERPTRRRLWQVKSKAESFDVMANHD